MDPQKEKDNKVENRGTAEAGELWATRQKRGGAMAFRRSFGARRLGFALSVLAVFLTSQVGGAVAKTPALITGSGVMGKRIFNGRCSASQGEIEEWTGSLVFAVGTQLHHGSNAMALLTHCPASSSFSFVLQLAPNHRIACATPTVPANGVKFTLVPIVNTDVGYATVFQGKAVCFDYTTHATFLGYVLFRGVIPKVLPSVISSSPTPLSFVFVT